MDLKFETEHSQDNLCTRPNFFFIADLHFDDKNILEYENRPFTDVQHMNEQMIANWNAAVSENDEIYVIGDFGGEGREKEILAQLKGHKYLIKGNHDVMSNDYYREAGFAEVYNKPIILNEFWMLSHEPLYVNSNMPYANLFGHVHASPVYRTFSSHHYCVSAERIQYQPISLQEIKAAVKAADKGSLLEE